MCADANSEKLKITSMISVWVWSKVSVAYAISQEWIMNWADFLYADNGAITFGFNARGTLQLYLHILWWYH